MLVSSISSSQVSWSKPIFAYTFDFCQWGRNPTMGLIPGIFLLLQHRMVEKQQIGYIQQWTIKGSSVVSHYSWSANSSRTSWSFVTACKPNRGLPSLKMISKQGNSAVPQPQCLFPPTLSSPTFILYTLVSHFIYLLLVFVSRLFSSDLFGLLTRPLTSRTRHPLVVWRWHSWIVHSILVLLWPLHRALDRPWFADCSALYLVKKSKPPAVVPTLKPKLALYTLA